MNSWAKVSVGLVVFAFINLTMFIALSSPFETVLAYIEGEAEQMDEVENEYFPISDYTTTETVTLDYDIERIIKVQVKNGTSDKWTATSAYTTGTQTVSVQTSAMTSDSSHIHVRYVWGTVESSISSVFGMIRTIFGMTFVLSMVALGVWFFLGAHKDEYRQY